MHRDLFFLKSRKFLCHKDLSGFFGFMRKYEIRYANYYTKFHVSDTPYRKIINFFRILLYKISLITRQNKSNSAKKQVKFLKIHSMFTIFSGIMI